MQIIKDSIKTIAVSLIILSSISIVYAWTEPTSTPPAGNVKSPLTVSSDTQYKSGLLSAEYLTSYGTTLLGADGGNVGIGTTAPGAKLHVAGGNIYSDGDLYIGTAGAQKSIWLDGGYGTRITAGINRAPIQFYVNDAERVRFDANGNVGIGTTAPSEKLEVVNTTGPVYAKLTGPTAGLYLNSTSGKNWLISSNQASTGDLAFHDGTNYVMVMKNQNVGIGTTAPVEKLDVNGNINIQGNGKSAYVYFPVGESSSGLHIRSRYQPATDLLFINNRTGDTTIKGRLTVNGSASVSGDFGWSGGHGFGGAYSPTNWYAVPNRFTGGYSCPAGFTGVPARDNSLVVCVK